MAVPDFQALFLPVLQQCADGEERGMREVERGHCKGAAGIREACV